MNLPVGTELSQASQACLQRRSVTMMHSGLNAPEHIQLVPHIILKNINQGTTVFMKWCLYVLFFTRNRVWQPTMRNKLAHIKLFTLLGNIWYYGILSTLFFGCFFIIIFWLYSLVLLAVACEPVTQQPWFSLKDILPLADTEGNYADFGFINQQERFILMLSDAFVPSIASPRNTY